MDAALAARAPPVPAAARGGGAAGGRMRAAVGGGKALIPANAKVGPIGTAIDLPLGHKDNAWSFDHIDTMTVMVGDAPRPDEIVLCMAVADGPRAHPRVGKGPVADPA